MSLHGCTVCTILQAVIVKLQASVNEIADLQRIVIRQMSRPSSRQSVAGRACFAFLLYSLTRVRAASPPVSRLGERFGVWRKAAPVRYLFVQFVVRALMLRVRVEDRVFGERKLRLKPPGRAVFGCPTGKD